MTTKWRKGLKKATQQGEDEAMKASTTKY